MSEGAQWVKNCWSGSTTASAAFAPHLARASMRDASGLERSSNCIVIAMIHNDSDIAD
jgi:hypothetical protein